MKFNESYEESLKSKLLLVLNDCKVSRDLLIPKHIIFSDHLKKFRSELLKKTKSYLEDFDEVSIIMNAFSNVKSNFDLNTDDAYMLNEVSGLVEAVAKNVIEQIKHLPYEYNIFLDLGVISECPFNEIEICEEFTIIYHQEESISYGSDQKIIKGHCYLVGKFSGYIENNSNHENVLNFLNKLKVILYIGIMTNALKRDTRVKWWGKTAKNLLCVNLKDMSSCEFKLESEFGEFLDNFLLSTELKERGKLFLTSLSQDLDEKIILSWEETHNDFIKFSKSIIKQAELDNSDKSLFSAIIWALKAQYTNDLSMSFVQGCIALEALLSDEIEKQRLNVMLADRFSYIIGRSNEKRRELRKDFNQIYSLRSKIVHGSVLIFHNKEKDNYYKLMRYLETLIKHEINNTIHFSKI